MSNTLGWRLDSPVGVVIIVATVYLLFLIVRLSIFGFNPAWFIAAGDKFCDHTLIPNGILIYKNSAGYDGEFYYRLALNPFTSRETEFGIQFDFPAYRQQRIIYPLLVWIFSFGNPQLIPWMLIAINYIGLCCLAWFGAQYAKEMHQSAFWGILLPLFPGFILTLSRDLTEIITVMFLVGSLLYIRKTQPILATILLILAIFTKETAIIAAGAIFCIYSYAIWKKKSHPLIPWYVAVVPIIVYIGWQILLWLHWRQIPGLSGNKNLGIPLLGFISFIREIVELQTIHQKLWFIEIVYLLFLSLVLIYTFRRATTLPVEKLILLFYAGLISLLTTCVWTEDWAFLRTISEYYVFGIISILTVQNKWRTIVFIVTIILWLALFWTRANTQIPYFL
ncbi:MAG: AZOBR_p60025 family cell surface glycopolymer formation protein [bacterium]